MPIEMLAQIENELFYYYEGEKIYLKENSNRILIKVFEKTNLFL